MSTEIYNKRQENLKNVLGEKGLDGMDLSGFENIDVHMTDLIEGRENLEDTFLKIARSKNELE